MSVGPMGPVVYSVAGSSLAQTTSSDVVRARQDAVVQQRGLEATQQTQDASGIGKTDGDDNQTNERDADGRSPWLLGRKDPGLPKEEADEEADEEATGDAPLEATLPNASSEPGSHLDLSG